MAHDTGRRTFLARAFGVLATIYASLLGVPIVRYLLSPLRHPTMREPDAFVRIGRIADFPLHRPVQVSVSADLLDAWNRIEDVRLGSVWVVRTGGDDFRVFSTICPHLGCGIGWEEEKERFSCPCHESHFRLDGTRIGGPAPRGMDSLEFKIEAKDVFVKYVRFVTGTKERRVIAG
ncbi:MAG: Rieske (2Fe-2S) protein [Deltaproteobacteria bacterium]|nr:MAG: Rieske (2Fe-2S) protein [Deltaproteobacteria bacterium]